MGEDFTLARLFYIEAAARQHGESEETRAWAGLAFDRLTYQEKIVFNDGLRAVFRAAAANPELARGLQ